MVEPTLTRTSSTSENNAPVLLTENLPGGQRGIRLLTLNRPERKNALSPDLVDALRAALFEAERDKDVRVVVITGALAEGGGAGGGAGGVSGGGGAGGKGSVFCAGGDLGGSGMQGDGFFEQHKERGGYAELLLQMRRMSKPLVAAVNGLALGGGLGLVLACDIAVAADDADLGTPEVKRGLFPMMISALMYEQLPHKIANELVLLGGKMAGERAVNAGIVNKVVPRGDVLREALVYAVQMASLSPSVLQLGKRAIATQHDMPFEQKVMFLRDQLTLNIQLEDAAEGIRAFLEKREPKWSGR